MHEAMLLLDAFPVGQVDLGAARLDDGQRRPDQVHRVLACEALA